MSADKEPLWSNELLPKPFLNRNYVVFEDCDETNDLFLFSLSFSFLFFFLFIYFKNEK